MTSTKTLLINLAIVAILASSHVWSKPKSENQQSENIKSEEKHSENKHQEAVTSKKTKYVRPKWKYKWVSQKIKRGFNKKFIRKLNRHGKNGWEVITVYQNNKYLIAILKRKRIPKIIN